MSVEQTSMNQLITDNIDIWTSTVKTKSASGRGSSKKRELYGVKKLRELILELAVRGKLVPQDPTDEPASVLLERIAAEKAQLVKEKKIKKSKKLSEISDSEKTLLLPKGWEYSRLGEFVSIIRGITFPASAKHHEPSEGLVACLRTANVQHQIDWDDLLYVDRSYLKREEQKLAVGDIVMSMANSRELVGKVSYTYSIPVQTDATFGGFLSVIRPYQLDSEFLMMLLRSPRVRNELIGSSSQTTNIANISLEKLNPLVTVVPPLKEQHRIVAKVDELMMLCDQLEQQTEASIEAHQVLVKTLLDTLTNSADADELMQNWQMVSEHFETLFTTEESIDQLKQTILQLAVMGKLVPQDPTDEPAAKLLERIAEEKAQLIKDKKIKKQKALPPIADDEKPFELPNGWEWVHCADTARPETVITYGILKPVWKTEGVATARIKDMIDGEVVLDDIVYCCPKRASKFEKTTLIEGDLLIAKDGGTLGKTAFVPLELQGGNVTQHVLRFSISPTLSKEFIRLIIDSPIGQGYMKGETKGVALPGVNVGDFRKMPVALPPIEEQRRIVSTVNQMVSICEQLKASLKESHVIQWHLTDAIVKQAV